MSKREGGWTYLELIIALMVFSLLVVTVYPLLTVFNASDVEKKKNLQALWLGQAEMERQIAVASGGRLAEGRETVQLDRDAYEVSWKREPVGDNLDLAEVKVRWHIRERPREIHLERYISFP